MSVCNASSYVVGVQVELVNLLDLQMLQTKDSDDGEDADTSDNKVQEEQLEKQVIKCGHSAVVFTVLT